MVCLRWSAAKEPFQGISGAQPGAPVEASGAAADRLADPPEPPCLIGEVADFSQFKTIAELLKFAGLNLFEISSGEHQGQRRISKRGRPLIRKLLYFAALRYSLPVYLLAYLAFAFFWRSFLVWKRTGVNPLLCSLSETQFRQSLLQFLDTVFRNFRFTDQQHFKGNQFFKWLYPAVADLRVEQTDLAQVCKRF